MHSIPCGLGPTQGFSCRRRPAMWSPVLHVRPAQRGRCGLLQPWRQGGTSKAEPLLHPQGNISLTAKPAARLASSGFCWSPSSPTRCLRQGLRTLRKEGGTPQGCSLGRQGQRCRNKGLGQGFSTGAAPRSMASPPWAWAWAWEVSTGGGCP